MATGLGRYGAKLLFQYRVDRGGEPDVYRLVEERIVTLAAPDADHAYRQFKRIGRAGGFAYHNDEGHKVVFEFVGVMDMKDLDSVCDDNESWYELKTMKQPMERRASLIPAKSQLKIFGGSWPARRKK
ncbi:DUF4288 domain-containing protein [Tahibacter amnicola]|uniref:DUF4288 domain-containing protein n=1 Tax=Tahibacter amnicola TaxID=2976241 RepID=A0ABY6BLJ1_9GAMM|nr:DUF4288 domain-containing protein [Tahibacter amnicola]UXI70342.1 DUF4288 domain-containing protein [Tahibacter amnicola]